MELLFADINAPFNLSWGDWSGVISIVFVIGGAVVGYVRSKHKEILEAQEATSRRVHTLTVVSRRQRKASTKTHEDLWKAHERDTEELKEVHTNILQRVTKLETRMEDIHPTVTSQSRIIHGDGSSNSNIH